MSAYEFPDNPADAQESAPERADVQPADSAADVALPEGVGSDADAVALEAADAADEEFGQLDTVVSSYVHVDLDQARARIDAAFVDATKAEGGSENGDGNAEDLDVPVHRERAGDSQRTEASGDSPGQPPGPPEDPFDALDTGDDPEGPEDEIEKQATIAETTNLLSRVGRFTHGPEGEPLRLGNDDSIIAVSIATLEEAPEDHALTPETVIGNKARTERLFEDLGIHAVIQAETLNEEMIPLAKDLDRRTGEGRTPIARFSVTAEPISAQIAETGDAEAPATRPYASLTVWINKNLRSDVYVDYFAMDRESGSRVETFLQQLGFGDVTIPTHDQRSYGDQYYPNTSSQILSQINQFVRSQL